MISFIFMKWIRVIDPQSCGEKAYFLINRTQVHYYIFLALQCLDKLYMFVYIMDQNIVAGI